MLIRLLITAFLVLAATPAWSLTLYVDGNDLDCNDATSRVNNSASAPWCTLGRAVWGSTNRNSPNSSQAAQAGDTVLISAGTYNSTYGSGSRLYPAFNPANSGSSGNYITFQGVGNVYLRSTNGNGPVIGSAGRDYIIWDNFIIDEVYVNAVSDTGPVVVWEASYVTVKGLTVTGDPAKTWADNHNGIRIERSDNITVQNCEISGFDQGDPGNYSGITLYWSTFVTIENNEIYNNGSGIFVKGSGSTDQGAITIRHNRIHNHDAYDLYFLGCEYVSSTYSKVYQNILYGSGDAIKLSGASDPGPEYIYFVNNTILGTDSIDFSTNMTSYGDEIIFRNNIFRNTGRTYVHGMSWVAGWLESDRNVHYIGGGNPIYYNTSYVSLSSWNSTTSQDANSINQDPLFTNVGTGDYTLQGTSPALTLGRTITAIHGTSGQTIPAGAYITGDEIIGLTSGAAVCSPQYRNLCDVSNCETTGEGYWYDDTCNAAEEPVPNNGACGSNDGGTFSSLTSGDVNNCSAGTLADFSGTGPWTWSCDGSQGGTNASCSASLSDCTSSAALCTSRTDCTTNWPTYNWCTNVCQEAGCPGGGFGQAPYSPTNFVRYSATSFAPFIP